MALVIMVDCGIETQGAQGPDSSYSEEQLLLEPVLPVPSVELVRNLLVLRDIVLKVRIEEIEVGTAHGHLPYTGAELASGHGNPDLHPGAVSVEHGFGRNLHEVLCRILRHLVALGRDTLGEIAVLVQQAYSNQVDIHVAGLLEIISGEYSEATRIDSERGVESVLHAKICDGRFRPLRLLLHIGVELPHDIVQTSYELLVLREFLVSLYADLVQYLHWIVSGLVPQAGVHALEKRLCVIIPAPPEVLAEGLETQELLRQVSGHHYALPRRRSDFVSVHLSLFILYFFSAIALSSLMLKSLRTFI